MAVSRSSHEQQDSGERKRDKPNDDDDMPPENFEYLSIFPNSSDLDWTEKPFLRYVARPVKVRLRSHVGACVRVYALCNFKVRVG